MVQLKAKVQRISECGMYLGNAPRNTAVHEVAHSDSEIRSARSLIATV